MAKPQPKRISQLDASSPLTGAEQIALVQNTKTVKTTLATVKDYTDTSCQCTLASRYNEVGVPATTVTYTFQSYTVPANTLSTDGSWLHITAVGKFAATANAKTSGIGFKQNNISVSSIGRATGSYVYNDYYWSIELKVQRSSSSTFMRTAFVNIIPYNAGSQYANTSVDSYTDYVSGTIDWSNDIQIFTFGDSASGTANDITCGQFIVSVNHLDVNS